ncbi:MAG: tRNA uridine(34) 5-carboxymethylaminomethyl modification radical SAM/GNAT enzyme Elp3 [Candidatus Lokiarchaeota archaeon]|nr:tRNA uridine(34) 5-carboxymethylaminomethyl modification radical SAM/GNAT enzyme Elp3 [Candidatus Lokiarchaeota archaeon]
MPLLDEEYQLYREIIDRLLDTEETLSKRVVNRIKNQVCKIYGASRVPSNADVLQAAIPEELDILIPIMQKRPVRTVSGVAVVATMTKPIACPHGKCAYCPGGPDFDVPQSYTGHEPATMRGIQNDFDPYKQVTKRLNQLTTIGHSVQKVELIVMGGDWCSKEREYREWFVKNCLDAMNGVSSNSLTEAKQINETAIIRNVGITFETRPDWVTDDSIDDMLEMGGTRVEIGVQTLSDTILEKVQRGHDTAATIRATKKIRDSGLKVCYHMMPGLPGSTLEQDLETFEQLFTDSRFCPDMLKIYPTIVVKNTKLYEWWTSGEYEPLSTDQVVSLVSRAVSKMPEYVRIQRMQRDIPLHQIEAGLDKGHLRELVHQQMKKNGLRNSTIRYREIGHFQMRSDTEVDPAQIELIRRDYRAGDGTEIFLSYEHPDLDILFGFLRLRYPSDDAMRVEIRDTSTVVIRELRVYGPVVDLGQRDPDAWQHLGLGEKMMHAAYQIGVEDFDARQILVNSGIGVKEYYRKLGFSDKGPYLARALQ